MATAHRNDGLTNLETSPIIATTSNLIVAVLVYYEAIVEDIYIYTAFCYTHFYRHGHCAKSAKS